MDNYLSKHYIKNSIAICSFFLAPLASADDSEIFFSNHANSNKPNVLFLLDTSGNMNKPPSDGSSFSTKMQLLKDAVILGIQNDNVKNARLGMFSFNTGTYANQVIADVDAIDQSRNIKLDPSGTTTFTLESFLKRDDGFEQGGGSDITAMDLNGTHIYVGGNTIAGFRFDNLLLNKSASNSPLQAHFKFINKSERKGTIRITLDPAANSKPFRREGRDFSSRFTTYFPSIKCVVEGERDSQWGGGKAKEVSCDISSLIIRKIAEQDWQAGNAISLLVQYDSGESPLLFFKDNRDYAPPKLEIRANNNLIAQNKRTMKDQLTKQVEDLNVDNADLYPPNIVNALYDVSTYLTDIPQVGQIKGPYHNNKIGASPIISNCQTNNIILITDPSDKRTPDSHLDKVKPYIGVDRWKEWCKVDGTIDEFPQTDRRGESCGRLVSRWLTNTPHSKRYKTNDIILNTIGFNVVNNDGKAFLEDMAKLGNGKYYNAQNTDGVIDAINDSLNSALIVQSPTASGQVTVDSQDRYRQREEIYYSFYESDNYDYWSGNMKGYYLKYQNVTLQSGKPGQRAILVDRYQYPAMDTDGTIKKTASSRWSQNDGNNINQGGVLQQLSPNPQQRKILAKGYAEGPIDSSTFRAPYAFGLPGFGSEQVVEGLQDFMRGYSYEKGGVKRNPSLKARDRKIGDSAGRKLQFLNYSCSDPNLNIMTCPSEQLEQLLIVPSNDGVLRFFEAKSGKVKYELMLTDDETQLYIINKLKERKAVNGSAIRTYGIDGNPVVYYDEKDKYVYVAKGRGAASLFAIKIESKWNTIQDVSLAWMIDKSREGFQQLGNTWSTPITTKIKVGNSLQAVLIFGAGYDRSNDSRPEKHTHSKGNAIYVVDAKTGKLIWSTINANITMPYSIPSPVAILENKEQMATDIFVGDMGGQLWRFKINNGKSGTSLIVTAGGNNGVVASIAGEDKENSRRFYHAPAIYKLRGGKSLSVNIGSGYKAHPLVTYNVDSFYSFRLPVEANLTNKKVLTENDLAVSSEDGQSLIYPEKLVNGFRIKLGSRGGIGEKIISDLYADFDRVVFNTYIPPKESTNNSCTPQTGTMRTYNIDLNSGLSLLQNPFIESSLNGLPPDVNAYCNDKMCTIISSSDQLSADKELPDGKCLNASNCDPFIGIIQNCGSGTGQACVVKTTWTDLFDPTVKN